MRLFLGAVRLAYAQKNTDAGPLQHRSPARNQYSKPCIPRNAHEAHFRKALRETRSDRVQGHSTLCASPEAFRREIERSNDAGRLDAPLASDTLDRLHAQIPAGAGDPRRCAGSCVGCASGCVACNRRSTNDIPSFRRAPRRRCRGRRRTRTRILRRKSVRPVGRARLGIDFETLSAVGSARSVHGVHRYSNLKSRTSEPRTSASSSSATSSSNTGGFVRA